MPADLTPLFKRGVVLPNVTADSPRGALTVLSEALAARIDVACAEILTPVMAREQLGPTGLSDGVAIPHARLRELAAPVAAFGRLATPLDFDAIDGAPCDLVFLLIAPLKDGAAHLRSLAQVSRVMRQSSVRSRIRQAESADAILEIFCPSVTARSATG